MLKTRGRKVISDILSRKARTAMVAISIFVGVLGVVTLVGSGDILINQLENDIKPSQLAMEQLFVRNPTGDPVENPREQLQAIESQMQADATGLETVEGRVTLPIQWKENGEELFSDGYIRAFSEPFEDLQLDPTRLLDGRYPAAGQNEIAIEQRMADKYGLGIGDNLALRIQSKTREGDVVPQEEWQIVGIVYHAYSDFTGGILTPADKSIYANHSDAEYIAGFSGYTAIYARYDEYQHTLDNAEHFIEVVSQNTPYVPAFNWMEDPSDNSFIRISKQYIGVLSVLGMIAMLVSGFLVVNVISTIVVEQRKQIGIMKSLGATSGDVFLMYAGIALTYGVLGTIPGILLGIPAAYYLGAFVAQFAGSYISEFTISSQGLILGLLMGLGVPVLAALIPVLMGTRVTIIQAITDLGISADYGQGMAAKAIGTLPVPMIFRQALSNVYRKKGRLFLTGITLTLAVAAFMGVTAVFSSVNDVIDDAFNTINFELQVSPTSADQVATIEEVVASTDGIEGVYPGVSVAVGVDGYQDPQLFQNQLSIIGIDPATNIADLTLTEGDGWANDSMREGVVLTFSVADQLGKKVGDSISFTTVSGKASAEIIGIATYPFDLAFMEWHHLAQLTGNVQGAPQPPNEYFTVVSINNDEVPAMGISNTLNEQSPFPITTGVFPTAENPGVVISQSLADSENYALGDSLTLTGSDHAQAYVIVGILDVPASVLTQRGATDVGVSTSAQAVNAFVLVPWADLVAMQGESTTGEAQPNVFFVRTEKTDPTAAEVDKIIVQLRDRLLDAGVPVALINQVQLQDEGTQQMLTIGTIFNIAAGVMAAVGAIGLLTSLSMAVFERQKEIGVMRSIGADSFTVAFQFLIEGVMVSLVAWLIGVPLSYVLSLGLMEQLPFGDFVDFSYPVFVIGIGFVGILVVAIVSSLWPSLSAARRTVSDILRYQ